MTYFTLKNGVKIPSVGYGTWRTPDGQTCVDAVTEALRQGYRHIDTAAVYKNHASVGRAVRESGIGREELFITSKLWNTEHSYEKALKAFDKTLKELGLDYLDLYLIHWPRPAACRDRWEKANDETWRALEELYEAGKIRAIGVSNFLVRHLDALLKHAKITPMVNQIEINPGFLQKEVTDYCQQRGILVEAWAPFAVGRVFALPELKALAEKYQRPVSQIVLRWYLQNNILPLPKSITPERIKENIGVFDFALTDEDVAGINRVKASLSSGHDPDNIDF